MKKELKEIPLHKDLAVSKMKFNIHGNLLAVKGPIETQLEIYQVSKDEEFKNICSLKVGMSSQNTH